MPVEAMRQAPWLPTGKMLRRNPPWRVGRVLKPAGLGSLPAQTRGTLMETVLKVLAALCIGFGAMWGVQTWWLSSIKKQIAAAPAVTFPTVRMTPVAKIDASKLQSALYPKLDPN